MKSLIERSDTVFPASVIFAIFPAEKVNEMPHVPRKKMDTNPKIALLALTRAISLPTFLLALSNWGKRSIYYFPLLSFPLLLHPFTPRAIILTGY